MTKPRFKAFKVQGTWIVVRDGLRDDDLTIALEAVLASYSLTTRPRCVRFFIGFMNHGLGPNDDPDAALFRDVAYCRTRIWAYLLSVGYRIEDAKRPDGSYFIKPGKRLCMSFGSVGLNALGSMYRYLKAIGLRSDFDPTRVDGYETWMPEQKMAMAELIFGNKRSAEQMRYYGSYFACKYDIAPAVRMDNAAGLGGRVLAAGRAHGWCRSIYDLVSVMAEDGPRFVDIHALTAEDWAMGSFPRAFGQSFFTPDKRSKGVRVKYVLCSSGTRLNLRESFNQDPSRPDMAVLEALLAAGDFAALRKIYLFPSQRGTPFKYGTFNNRYFRPAMESANVPLQTARGLERPTGHRLRSARIQEDADTIFEDSKTEKEIQLNIDRLKRDVHLKSRAIWRYIGPAKHKFVAKGRLLRMKARLANRRFAMDKPHREVDLDPVARLIYEHR